MTTHTFYKHDFGSAYSHILMADSFELKCRAQTVYALQFQHKGIAF